MSASTSGPHRSASDPPGRRALVIGGSGFLGGHVARALGASGFEVSTTTRNIHPAAGCATLDLVQDGPGAIAGEIGRARPDVVVNCAGCTGGTATEMIEGNVTAAVRLLAAVARAAPGARLVHLGSAGEYGAAGAGGPVGEDAGEEPTSAYGVSKLAGTRLLLHLSADAGVEVVVLRIFNPIGPGAPGSSLPGRTARLIREALENDPHPDIDTAPLGSYRDFVDTRDVGSAVVAAATVTGIAGRVYNIGSGRAVCARDLVELLVAVSGFRGRVREGRPAPERSVTVSWQQADIARATSDLGWRPGYELPQTVADFWQGAASRASWSASVR